MKNYDKYLSGEYMCACGDTHSVSTKKIEIERRAIYKVPDLIDALSLPKDVFVLCNENTLEAAGNKIIEVLEKADFKVRSYTFKNEKLKHVLFCVSH